MAGSGRRVFTPGEVLTASNVMNYLQDQAVMVFPNSGARGSAIGSAVSDGMVSYLQDSNAIEVYKTSGTAIAKWEPNTTPQSPNVIINGAFDIWQRGTSFAASGYTADRWTGDFVTGAGTVSRQTFTPGAAPVAGYEGQFFLRRSVTTGAQFSSLIHRIEDVRTFAGQTVTLSFWAKGTNPTGNFTIAMIQNFGSGGSGDASVGAGTLTLTADWTRYTYTFNLPSVSGKTIGANSYVWLSIYQTAANTSASTLDIWGVQLEAGSTATPFRRNANSLQGELAACQRYYQRFGGTATFEGFPMSGPAATAGIAYLTFPHGIPLRTNATSIEFSNIGINIYGGAIYAVTGATIAVNNSGRFGTLVAATGSGFPSGSIVFLSANNSLNGFIALSAEL